jgi:hypothetical protein
MAYNASAAAAVRAGSDLASGPVRHPEPIDEVRRACTRTRRQTTRRTLALMMREGSPACELLPPPSSLL